jgi:peptidoglycan/xylan/chitin deacetylase (PgdA/CDA1 family)
LLQDRSVERLARIGLPVYCGGRRGRYVALTFDDGPRPDTALALHILARFRASATFFDVGREIVRRPRLVLREAKAGAVGDHTWSHPFLLQLGIRQIRLQLASTRAALAALVGQAPIMFRPPYGEHDRRVDRIARTLGMLEVLWSDSGSDTVPHVSWNQVAFDALAALEPGSIVVLHENRGQTIRALREAILPALARRHLVPVTVPVLMALDPPSLRQLRAGWVGCVRNL